MNGSFATPRAFDHCVLPTADLDVAAARLAALGFTVAPKGVHPFGTANRCVYFADGTFLEPLAADDAREIAAAIEAGNVFAGRFDAYRRRHAEGFSALVFGTEDALADHRTFTAGGLSGGPTLDFSRNSTDATGKSGHASFRLAFAGDPQAPDCLIFTCQRVAVPAIDRSSLVRHANGVVRIRSLILTAPDPRDASAFVASASGARATAAKEAGRAVLRAANCSLEIVDDRVFSDAFGPFPAPTKGLQARAIVFGVADLPAAASLLSSASIDYRKRGSRLVVMPAAGQGAVFAFEENP